MPMGQRHALMSWVFVGCGALGTAAGTALAQGPLSPPSPAPAATRTPAQRESASTSLAPRTGSELTDHQRVLRSWGLGWLGVSNIPIAVAQPEGSAESPGLAPNDRVDTREVAAPIIALRYWLNETVAIEPGFGFHYSTGSVQSELADVSKKADKQPTTAMIAHFGVPIALATRRHMTLVVVPETHVGVAWSKASAPFDEGAPPEASLYGSRIDAGAHAGAEIQFGFMGLEALALEVSVACYYSFRRVSAAEGNQKVTDTSVVLGTSSLSQPWDIFSSYGRLAARYYF